VHARIQVVLSIAFLSSACGDAGGPAPTSSTRPDPSQPAYGEPALVRMEAPGGLPYEMAIALAGADIGRVIEPLTTSVHLAVGDCPGTLDGLGAEEVANVRFSVTGGATKRSPDGPTPSNDCLIGSLTKRGVQTKETFEAWVQLRKSPAKKP